MLVYGKDNLKSKSVFVFNVTTVTGLKIVVECTGLILCLLQ